MRVDKYLWCIRVFKTRTLAATNCKAEKIWINGELVKASREVKVGDVVKVRKGPIHFSFQVIAFPTSRIGAKLVMTYTKDVTDPIELEKMERIRLQNQVDRPRGLGRPTKRDRRDLDSFFDYDENDELWTSE
ncbi:MAG: RNA-binding S4 domain-containing protein [Flavobacteriales bacterium]|jgi:ribosome-associated heat shock protein Hsp15